MLGTVEARPISYSALLSRVKARQSALASRYSAASSQERQAILSEAETFLEHALADSIWPCWVGTRWDFNGTTQTPRSGKIACGYFVTTCLRDAGYKVERVKWAQLGPEPLVKQLVGRDGMMRSIDEPVADFVRRMVRAGDGVYVIGLNSHVGFLLVRDSEVWFCHSDYMPPAQVKMQRALESSALLGSTRRYVGSIVPNDALTGAWLSGDLLTHTE
jgi:hypothetical protein